MDQLRLFAPWCCLEKNRLKIVKQILLVLPKHVLDMEAVLADSGASNAISADNSTFSFIDCRIYYSKPELTICIKGEEDLRVEVKIGETDKNQRKT